MNLKNFGPSKFQGSRLQSSQALVRIEKNKFCTIILIDLRNKTKFPTYISNVQVHRMPKCVKRSVKF